MKKIFFLLLAISPTFLQAQVVKRLNKAIELKMPKTADDEMCGKRGACIVWDPNQKKYYAAFAGNKGFPLAVFNAAGIRLSEDDQTALVDTRGLWYNIKLKKLCGNGYNEAGWFRYTTDAKGMIGGIEVYIEGMNQPDKQSVGAYNAKTDMVYFLSGYKIHSYNAEGMEEEDSTINLYPGLSKKEDSDGGEPGDDYNNTTVIYTAIPKAEFGLLNIVEKQIELYNRKTGLMTQKLKLPDGAATEATFNFSYTNGAYWLFNMDTRTWTGYK